MVDQGRELCKNPMQKWLDDNRILMQLTINEGKSVVAERVLKTFMGKIYKTMTANDSKSYLRYLSKSVDKCNNWSPLYWQKIYWCWLICVY